MVGDSRGLVHFVSRQLEVLSHRLFEARVSQLAQLKFCPVLAAAGVSRPDSGTRSSARQWDAMVPGEVLASSTRLFTRAEKMTKSYVNVETAFVIHSSVVAMCFPESQFVVAYNCTHECASTISTSCLRDVTFTRVLCLFY